MQLHKMNKSIGTFKQRFIPLFRQRVPNLE